MILIRPNKDSLILKDLTEIQMNSAIELLKEFGADYDIPVYPKWDNWSEKIPLTSMREDVSEDWKKSGVYKIYHKDEIIYIGETRSSTRAGMWARRYDFRSTIKNNNKIKNPYGNGTKFLEVFGIDEIENVSHQFHVVHPFFCKQAEIEQLKIYYDEHKKLPILHNDIDYDRTLKQIEIDNTPSLDEFMNNVI